MRAEHAAKQQAPWPEFTEYSCFACHKNLGPANERWQPLTASDRAAGALPWGSSTITLLPVIAENPSERAAVDKLNELQRIMQRDPAKTEGIAARCIDIINDLDAWLRRLEQSAEQDSLDHPYSSDALASKFRAIAANALTADRSRFNNLDWAGAFQHYLGLAAIDRALDKSRRTPQLAEPLDELRKQLQFPPGFNSPHDAKPSEILKMFQKLSAVPVVAEPRP